jgi:hypothetical protein
LTASVSTHPIPIERIQNSFIAEINAIFGTDEANKVLDGVGIDASDCQIIDLATDEHAMALKDTLVQAPLVGCRREAVTSDDRVHKLFPERTGFRTTLEGVLDTEHHLARDSKIHDGQSTNLHTGRR